MIRCGQRIRYWGPDRIYTRWNHAAIFVADSGDIVEALGGGVQRRNISVYKETEYHVVRLQNVTGADREHEIEFPLPSLNPQYRCPTIFTIPPPLLFPPT